MKVFASDYDGTIRIDGDISARNLDAIKAWVESGNIFGIVTGRSVESMLSDIQKYKLPVHFLVCNNGGVVYDKDMNLLQLFEMNLEKALLLMEEIRGMNCNSFVVNNGWHRAKEVVNSEEEDTKYGAYSGDYTVARMVDEKRIAQIVISLNDDVYGHTIATHINETYKGYMNAFPNTNCVDIVPDQISKASGLSFIQEYFHYEYEDIYCMGDAHNDLPMLMAFQSATLQDTYEDVKQHVALQVKDVCEYLCSLENK